VNRRTWVPKSSTLPLDHRSRYNNKIIFIYKQIKEYGKMGLSTESLYADEFNSLNAELNPIGHLLALLRPHHILHFSRIRVKASISYPA
jgi:hypothetical protein